MTFRVSNSRIKTWRSCKRKYYYKYILKLRPRKKAPPLVRGTIIHNMLEAHINKGNPWSVFNEAKKSYSGMFKEEIAIYDALMEEVRALMVGYFDHYKKDDLKYIKHQGKYTEYHFEVDLTPSIKMVGYIDGAAKKDGFNWLVEHKSHAEIPTGDIKYSDIQGVIYAWAMPLIGLPKPDGVCWDYIRAKTPAKPELLKSCELSKRKNIDTIWPIYLEKIKEEKLNPSDYQDMKELLIHKSQDFYVRKYLPLNKVIVKGIMEDTITTAREIKRKAGRDKTRNIDRQCQWCDYYSLCQGELRGLDVKFIKENNFMENENADQETKK